MSRFALAGIALALATPLAGQNRRCMLQIDQVAR